MCRASEGGDHDMYISQLNEKNGQKLVEIKSTKLGERILIHVCK